MSTHSAIIQRMPDGSYRGIYCHFDGYLDHHGPILRDHYADADKVTALIDLGDILILRERVAPGGQKDVTESFMRDHGETDSDPSVGASLEDCVDKIDHGGNVYVFADGSWTHNGAPIGAPEVQS